MIPLYTDENVLDAITRGLRARGVDVLTAQEDGRTQTNDRLILDRATELGRVLFSQDIDLRAIAVARQRAGCLNFSGVVYAHQHEPIGGCV
jgi:predicted nuclease of predicted toxin-antitoxin system